MSSQNIYQYKVIDTDRTSTTQASNQLIDWLEFYAVWAKLQPCNGEPLAKKPDIS